MEPEGEGKVDDLVAIVRISRTTRDHTMNDMLLRALLALLPAGLLLSGSVVLSLKTRSMSSWLQVLGAGCLVVVVLAHISEALHLFAWMRWGLEDSVGHYVDLSSAFLGLTLFPLGYLIHAVNKR